MTNAAFGLSKPNEMVWMQKFVDAKRKEKGVNIHTFYHIKSDGKFRWHEQIQHHHRQTQRQIN